MVVSAEDTLSAAVFQNGVKEFSALFTGIAFFARLACDSVVVSDVIGVLVAVFDKLVPGVGILCERNVEEAERFDHVARYRNASVDVGLIHKFHFCFVPSDLIVVYLVVFPRKAEDIAVGVAVRVNHIEGLSDFALCILNVDIVV